MQGHLRAEAPQNPGQFHGDIAGAYDRRAGGTTLKLEEPVGRNPEFGPGDPGHNRCAARGDENALGRILLSFDGQRARGAKCRVSAYAVNTAPLEIVRVDSVQPADVALAPGHQFPEVVAVHGQIETVIATMAQLPGQLGGMPHDLLGHAAAIHAGAPQAVGFKQRNLRPVLCGALRRSKTAAAPAHHDQVVISHAREDNASGPKERRIPAGQVAIVLTPEQKFAKVRRWRHEKLMRAAKADERTV